MEELDERDLRNRINDKDLRMEYREFKAFQEMRKQLEGKATKKNPYPDVQPEKSGKRGANWSGSPSHKKKRDREVTIVQDGYRLPSVLNRVGRKVTNDEDSPWVPKGSKAKNKTPKGNASHDSSNDFADAADDDME